MPQPFQMTMRRFGRKLDVAAMREELPLAAFFFDCLRSTGPPDRPARARALRRAGRGAAAGLRVPRLVTADAEEAAALRRGGAAPPATRG